MFQACIVISICVIFISALQRLLLAGEKAQQYRPEVHKAVEAIKLKGIPPPPLPTHTHTQS